MPVDGRATQDSTESTFTTAPPPLRASTGANALVTFTGPKKLVSISARAAFSDGPSSDPPPAIPALSIRRVTSGASSAAAATDAPGRTRPAARGRGQTYALAITPCAAKLSACWLLFCIAIKTQQGGDGHPLTSDVIDRPPATPDAHEVPGRGTDTQEDTM
ncbi:MAG: hypothetical protein JWP64_867, partial [Pseudonocardia sp.]|nr:hypothetical protein [Pseudonocardia sp.]